MEDPKRVLGGRYELGVKQGEGGMGQVYRGRDLLKNQPVAVKLLGEEVSDDPVVRERFCREANVLRELAHPSLVKLHDSNLEGREPFLIFEFVEGERLDRVIGGRPMEVKRALALTQQIASALAALHARQVVHRDVKPANLMVRPDGTLCLLDFGTAKRFGSAERTAEQLTTEGFVIGTLQYMPPEALFQNGVLAPSYDVWSTGVVLWEMLVGSRPFVDVETRGMTAFMDALRACNIPPIAGLLPELPPAVGHLVRTLMERDAAERAPDGAAMLGMIEQAMATLEQPPGGATMRLSRKLPRFETPRALPISRGTASGGTLILKRPDGAPSLGVRALAAAGVVALLIGGVSLGLYLRAPGASSSASASVPADPALAAAQLHAEAVGRVARTASKNPFGLVNALFAAGGTVTADAPDEGRAVFAATLAKQGIAPADLTALDAARAHLSTLDGTTPEAEAIVVPLMALEFLDQFAEAVELPAGFRPGVSRALPPGYRQRAASADAVDLEHLTLAADGQGAPAVMKFTVDDPSRVSALWLALSGEALKRGHVVLVRVNEHGLSMGGMDPGRVPAGPRVELRRGLPARLLKAGENRLEARVLGAPAGSPRDPDGLKLAIRVRTS